MRVPKPRIIAGPIASENDALREAFMRSWTPDIRDHSDSGYHTYIGSRIFTRRTRRGWYVIERNRACTHAGSRRWRRAVRARMRERGDA